MVCETRFLSEAFERVYGARGIRSASAARRVNLIGEHTDYNFGFVLPMALDMACFIVAAPNGEGKLRVSSENLGEDVEHSIRDLAGACAGTTIGATTSSAWRSNWSAPGFRSSRRTCSSTARFRWARGSVRRLH